MRMARHPAMQFFAVLGIALVEPLGVLLLLNRSEAMDKFRRWRGTKDEDEIRNRLLAHWRLYDPRFHDATPQMLSVLMRLDLLKEYGQTALVLGRLNDDNELEARGEAVLAMYEREAEKQGIDPNP